eukprot:4382922-Lingulodinium_polyedra.AAC.1
MPCKVGLRVGGRGQGALFSVLRVFAPTQATLTSRPCRLKIFSATPPVWGSSRRCPPQLCRSSP